MACVRQSENQNEAWRMIDWDTDVRSEFPQMETENGFHFSDRCHSMQLLELDTLLPLLLVVVPKASDQRDILFP